MAVKTTYSPLVAEAHTPPYKIHRYFARRPWNVFKQLIEVYSEENEIVLDPFCGGGVTIYEGLRLKRRMVGFDINPLSIFIVRSMVKRDISIQELDDAFNLVKKYLEELYGDFNQISLISKDKVLFEQKVDIDWNELAFNVYCKYCGNLVPLSNKNRVANGRYYCINPKCSASKEKGRYLEPKDCKRDKYEYLFSVATSPLTKERLIIEYDAERLRIVKEHIRFLKKQLKKNGIKLEKDEIPLNWDRQHEDLLLQKGIKTFQNFFTERNLLLNLLVLNFIKQMKVKREIYEILRMVFSSSLRDTNIMSFTNENWQSGKPTTWAKHAYWIPSQFCEVSVLSALEKAFIRFRSAIIYNNQYCYTINPVHNFKDILLEEGNLFLQNASLEDSDIPDNSIDTIITDPPYGSNVQYLELSHFWYVWNKDLYGDNKPNFLKEAVCNRKKNFQGAKSMRDYEENLYKVFSKAYLVLKPHRRLVLTFNNKDMGAWLALFLSIFRAGFVFEKDGLFFQDGVDNYKQTAHTKYDGSPYGDFIYVFKKIPSVSKESEAVKEDNFIDDLDKSFKNYVNKFKNSRNDRNEIIQKMFLEVIPKIESFAKSREEENNNRILYSHFDKNYLKDIYR